MRKNRGYKKNEPFRDARLFVIACEGEKREETYFRLLGQASKRLKIRILSPNSGTSLSAPKWLLDRLVNFIDQENVNIETGDIVWVVMDVDRWETEEIHQLAQICKESKWGFALSNPCFEVWLLMHLTNIENVNAKTCKEMKRELGQVQKGGYNAEKFTNVNLVNDAIKRAEDADTIPQSPIPPAKSTRVYLPVKQILDMF